MEHVKWLAISLLLYATLENSTKSLCFLSEFFLGIRIGDCPNSDAGMCAKSEYIFCLGFICSYRV